MRSGAVFLIASAVACAQDPREIFRRSIEKDRVNRALLQQYTYLQKSVMKEFEKDGKVKSTKSFTHDVSIIYDHRYSRLTGKNGKPLSEKEEQKEKDRLEKLTA